MGVTGEWRKCYKQVTFTDAWDADLAGIPGGGKLFGTIDSLIELFVFQCGVDS